MVDSKKAKLSIALLKQSDGDVSILTGDERLNLVEIVDDFVEQQGWSKEEMEMLGYNETKVECPGCHATMVVRVAELKSNKLLRCLVCKTPIN